MVGTSFADESALLTELSSLAAQGRHRDLLDRLGTVPGAWAERTPFTLLAAEAHGRLGEHNDAERRAEQALALARVRHERQAELRAVNYQGAIAFRRGDIDRASERFEAALELARRSGDHTTEARCLNNLGILADMRGDADAAITSFQLALAAYQRAGLVRGLAETNHNIGISWRERGDLTQALASAEEAVRLARQVGDDSLVGLTLTGRADLHLRQQDAQLAAVVLMRAQEAYDRVRYRAGLPEVWRLQAAVQRTQADPAGATRLLEDAATLARELGSAHTLAEIERDLGVTLEARGDRAGAKAARERARDLFRRLGARRAAEEMARLLERS